MGSKLTDRERVFSRLNDVWSRSSLPELPLAGSKYVMMSDIHLGNGSRADDFNRNTQILHDALDYYYNEGYTLILLGDVEELWQFEMPEITKIYDTALYEMMRKFGANQRLHRVFGNHDVIWGSPIDPTIPAPPASRGAPEGLKIQDLEGKARMLLVHGHQGTKESDKTIWASQYWVRIWRGIEPVARWLGFHHNPSEAKSKIPKQFERLRYDWAESNHVLLICGHSHRAIFGSESPVQILEGDIARLKGRIKAGDGNGDGDALRKELKEREKELRHERRQGRSIARIGDKPKPYYFNTGCGLYTKGITAIELDQQNIQLVKWERPTSGTAQRYVRRVEATGAVLSQI